MAQQRSKRSDKFVARLRLFALQNFEPVWKVVQKVPFLERRINKAIINKACNAAVPRPHPMSTMVDYTSWRTLTDKTYLGRSLPPQPQPADLPSVADATQLFMPHGAQRECPKSTLLFPIFAQYLTDGFLRTDQNDLSKTTSNHNIDLSQFYGRTHEQTLALRLRANTPGQKGRMRSQMIDGEEFPPFLYTKNGESIAPEFVDADGNPLLDLPLSMGKHWTPEEHAQKRLFAVGGDRANATAHISMINTLFLREHNRLAGVLEAKNADWDDDRVFETTRNIIIAIFIKIVVEEYINHISSACFKIKADPKVAWHAKWNKPNWMTVEFSLLYRWHSLVPEKVQWDGAEVPSQEFLLDNSKLIDAGLGNAFAWSGATKAAKLDLHNTPMFLESPMLVVESKAIKQNRRQNLASFNRYRESMSMKPVDDFDCMTGDPARQEELRALYGSPDNVDFYVGLFAEDEGVNTPMPPLLGAMVALDAFSQALNNPLLSEQVFNARTFTQDGLDLIEQTGTIWDILDRNRGAKWPSVDGAKVRMTRSDWKRRFGAF